MATPGTVSYPGALDTAVSLFETNNKISTTLNGGISDSATSIILTSGTGWPASGTVSFNDSGEIVFYTGKSTNTLTGCLRGQDGSAAAAHISGVTVQLNDTSRHHQVHSEAIIAVETKIGTGASTPTSGVFLRGSGTGTSAWSLILAADIPTGVDVAKLSAGTVSNTVFGYLVGVTSSIQTQLNSKQASGTYLVASNNLSDLVTPATARTNLGLGTLATQSGTFSGTSSGTNTGDQTFNGLSPMTTLGDVIYGGASGTGTRLAGNTASTRKFLRQTGDGAASAAPAWDTVTKSDVGLGNVENTALTTWAGSTNLITLGTVTTGTWQGTTIGVSKGGTGLSSLTAYGLLTAGTTSTGNLQQVPGTGAAGEPLLSNGAGTLPTWGANESAALFVRTQASPYNNLISSAQFGHVGGPPAAGGGPRMLFFADNGSLTKSFMGSIGTAWENPAAGSEKSSFIFTVRANSEDIYALTEVARLNSSLTFLLQGPIQTGSYAFSALPTASNGMILYCTDAKNVADDSVAAGSVAVSGGSGTFVHRIHGAWRIFY
jgi:hypothetical protein